MQFSYLVAWIAIQLLLFFYLFLFWGGEGGSGIFKNIHPWQRDEEKSGILSRKLRVRLNKFENGLTEAGKLELDKSGGKSEGPWQNVLDQFLPSKVNPTSGSVWIELAKFLPIAKRWK